jgi:DNA primase large subunit
MLSQLSYAMAMAFKALPSVLRDERLRPILTNMSTAYVGPQLVGGTGTGDKITPAQIPAVSAPFLCWCVNTCSVFVVCVMGVLDVVSQLAESCMPLCMRSMYRALNETHHLKYTGRTQFGLFIKGIGLSMEDSLQFWQAAFSPVTLHHSGDCTSLLCVKTCGCDQRMSGEEFVKKYAYNIRHSYGKEGKRQDYTPSPCIRIVTSPPPGHSETHGA